MLLVLLCIGLSAFLMLSYPKTGIACLVVTGILTILIIIKSRRGFHKTLSDIAAVNASLDPNGRDLLDSFPMPVLVSDENGVIVWYNSRFANEVMGKDIVIEDTTIEQFTSGFGIDTIKKSPKMNVEFRDKKYTLFQNAVERREGELYVLYFEEDTELKNIKGIKEAKALNLAAIFELHSRLSIKEKESEENEIDGDYLYNKYKEKLSTSSQENLILIVLNSRRRILREKTLYIGTENNMLFSYKDIWRELLISQGKYFYLIHNHPGKSCSPSKEDKIFTSELFLESRRIKIPMIDHLIIGNDGYYSFLDVKK